MSDKNGNIWQAVDAHERGRDYITIEEFELILAAARQTRWPTRNQVIFSLMFRHGMRNSEVCGCLFEDVNLKTNHIWARRLKGGLSTMHPLLGAEQRLIKRYLATRDSRLPWLILSERDGQITRQAIYRLVVVVGKKAGIGNLHPHMFRHGCGFHLANLGRDSRIIQDYLGHRDPKHTAHYTRTAVARFNNLW